MPNHPNHIILAGPIRDPLAHWRGQHRGLPSARQTETLACACLRRCLLLSSCDSCAGQAKQGSGTNKMLDMNGKVALITGASSGIGWATGEALAARGAAGDQGQPDLHGNHRHADASAGPRATRGRNLLQPLVTTCSHETRGQSGGDRPVNRLSMLRRCELHHRHYSDTRWRTHSNFLTSASYRYGARI
jgi:hypothetical protein